MPAGTPAHPVTEGDGQTGCADVLVGFLNRAREAEGLAPLGRPRFLRERPAADHGPDDPQDGDRADEAEQDAAPEEEPAADVAVAFG